MHYPQRDFRGDSYPLSLERRDSIAIEIPSSGSISRSSRKANYRESKRGARHSGRQEGRALPPVRWKKTAMKSVRREVYDNEIVIGFVSKRHRFSPFGSESLRIAFSRGLETLGLHRCVPRPVPISTSATVSRATESIPFRPQLFAPGGPEKLEGSIESCSPSLLRFHALRDSYPRSTFFPVGPARVCLCFVSSASLGMPPLLFDPLPSVTLRFLLCPRTFPASPFDL